MQNKWYLPSDKWTTLYNFNYDAKKLIEDAKIAKEEEILSDSDASFDPFLDEAFDFDK